MPFLSFVINKDFIKKYIAMISSIKGLSTSIIARIKVLGALERPKYMTSHSYSLSLVLNVVFHSSLKRVLI